MFDGVGLRGRLVVAVAAHPGEAKRDLAGVAASIPGPRRPRSRRPARAGRRRRDPRCAIASSWKRSVCHRSNSSVRPLNVLPTMTHSPSLPPRAEVEVRQPARPPAVSPLDGDHDQVERVDRLHLAPRAATATGVVRGVEVLDHHTLVTARHRALEEPLRLDRVGGDDRGQPADARHGGARTRVAPTAARRRRRRRRCGGRRRRTVQSGAATGVRRRRNRPSCPGSAAACRRRHAEHLAVEHEVAAGQRRARRRRRRARRSVTSLRLRVKRRTSPSARWAWIRAPSSFQSTEASPGVGEGVGDARRR